MSNLKIYTEMKVWITKYALTHGIIETKVTKKLNVTDDYKKETEVMYVTVSERGVLLLKEDEFDICKQSAIAKAEQMRMNKIESLKKQIKKLELMKFE